MKVFMGAQKETEEAHEKIGHVLTETVSAVRTVTSFNLQSKIMERYETLKKHPHKVSLENGERARERGSEGVKVFHPTV